MTAKKTTETPDTSKGHHEDNVACCCQAISALTLSAHALHQHHVACGAEGEEKSSSKKALEATLTALQHEVDCLVECCGCDVEEEDEE